MLSFFKTGVMASIYKLSPLYGFSKEWRKKVDDFDATIKDQKEEVKEDLATYKNLVNILRQKGDLIVKGIESGESETVYENTRCVDNLAIQEDKFKIAGPITRQFAELYLELLKQFTNLKYKDIERDETNARAERERYLTIEQRIEDAQNKISRIESQMIEYDKEHPNAPPAKISR